MGFPRQEYWSELLFPSPGDLPDPGIETLSPLLPVGSLLLSHKSYISSFFFLPVFLPPILVLPTYHSNNKSLQAYHSIALISSPPPSPLSLFHQWQTLTFLLGLPQSSLLFQSSSSSIHGRKITVSSRLLWHLLITHATSNIIITYHRFFFFLLSRL